MKSEQHVKLIEELNEALNKCVGEWIQQNQRLHNMCDHETEIFNRAVSFCFLDNAIRVRMDVPICVRSKMLDICNDHISHIYEQFRQKIE